MPNKKILVSNDTGKYKEISGSVIDGQISSPSIIINTSSFNTEVNGLLQVVNGKIEAITGSGNNYKINYSTELGKFIAEQDTVGDLGGDLTGLYTSPRVKSVANVTTGILSTSHGGTGQSSYSSGSLVSSNGAILSPSENGDKVVAIGAGGEYVLLDKNEIKFTPMTGTIAYLYTGSVNITETFTWKKPGTADSLLPDAGTPRFIRVICQGGGASGRGGVGGRGGGGGGYSDIILNSFNVSDSVIVTVGSGGLGESISSNGGSSSFGNFVTALGGDNSLGTGGAGIIQSGGTGGQTSGASGANTTRAAPGGGMGGIRTGSSGTPPGGAGGTNTSTNAAGGAGGLGTGDRNGFNGSAAVNPTFVSLKAYINTSTTLQDIPSLSAGGGGGGGCGYSSPGRGGHGYFGSGGGGGGRGQDGVVGLNGSGGAGYVLIICY